MIKCGELERVREETVITEFKVISRLSLGGTEEIAITSGWPVPWPKSNLAPPEYTSEA
jgi:hypothetical protein